MRNIKLLATSLVALVIVGIFSSCEKKNEINSLPEISFTIDNLSYNSNYSSDNDSQHFHSKASYASIDIVDLSNNTITNYNISIFQKDNKPVTDIIRLSLGKYKVISFEVYNTANVLIWRSPETKSLYKGLWDFNGASYDEKANIFKLINKDKIFTLSSLGEHKINIKVLNWKAFNFDDYKTSLKDDGDGMEIYIKTATIKTICFFGDICTPNYTDWGKDYHDFVADFRISIIDIDGETILTTASTLDEGFEGGPLCMSYPDFIDREDDIYTGALEVWNSLIKEWILIGTIPFDANLTPSELIALTNPEDRDGILDFVIYEGANCNNSGNLGVNLNIPLP